ncbi:MAG: acetylxylan esterase [Saprospiraceae bacterium]|nr:acetylxylan esterase [Saprospiraceae bacterium]
MKNYLLYTLLLLSYSCTSQESISKSAWTGSITIFGQTEYALLDQQGDSLILNLPDRGPDAKYLISNIRVSNTKNYFQTQVDRQDWQFEGNTLFPNQLEGKLVLENGLQGRFHFYKVESSKSEDWFPCSGTYQLPSGEFLIVWDNNGRIRMHSALSQQYTRLQAIGPVEFYSSSCERLKFLQKEGDKYQALEWISSDGQSLPASRVADIRIEEHLIITDADTIGASLYLPNQVGKHPACIIPMGAANYDRSINDLEAKIFAAYGIATLIYDNYGSGKSSGSPQGKTFDDKQAQTVELYRWLQKHPEIDPEKIGIRGASQGGRIAVMAGAVVDPAFLVLIATPMETRMDQQLYALAAYHRQLGYLEEAIVQSSEIWRRFFLSAASGKVDTVLVEMAQVFASQYPDMQIPRPVLQHPPQLPWTSDILSNTSSYLPNVNAPIQCIFGPLDDRVPAQKSIHILRTTLEANGKNPPEVILYEGTSHSFMLPGFRIVPGLFMDQVRFMKRALQ